ncbi:MAG: ankyrin repeat domain-containing protein [Phycisphaerales bacterium]
MNAGRTNTVPSVRTHRWFSVAAATLLVGLLGGQSLLAAAAKPPTAPPSQPAASPPAATPPAVTPPAGSGDRITSSVTVPSKEELEKRRLAARQALQNKNTEGKPVDPNLSPVPSRPPGNVVVNPADLGNANPSTESKVIRFEPTELDLGEMTAEVSKTGNIKVVNITDKPVTISRVVPSCGCTTAPAPKDPIPAGGSVEIPITLKPGPKQGVSLAKRVTFQIEGEPPVVLNIKGHVAEYVSIEPELLTADPANPESGKITLRAVDGAPFKIIGVNPAIVTDYSNDAKVEHVVHVDWKKWEEAGSGVKVAFSIDHPKIAAVSGMIKRQITAVDRAKQSDATKVERPKPLDAGTSALVGAARKGDLAGMEEAIKAGAKLDDADRASGRNALHWAAAEGQLEAIAFLLKNNAAINAEDRTGKTALAVAAEKGKVDAVKALLKAGAEVNHRDKIKGSPLLWAAGLGNADTVRALVAAGADVTVADVNGLTPLLWAAGIGEPASVAVLLDAKADTGAKDSIDGDDALIRAVRSGKDETVKILIERGAKVDSHNDKGATALLVAAGSGSLEKIKLLVAAKSDINAKDNSGRTLLDYAKNRIDASKDQVVAYVEQISGQAAGQPKTNP